MGLSAYGIMMKGSSKEHHFSVRKQVVQWARVSMKELKLPRFQYRKNSLI